MGTMQSPRPLPPATLRGPQLPLGSGSAMNRRNEPQRTTMNRNEPQPTRWQRRELHFLTIAVQPHASELPAQHSLGDLVVLNQ